MSLSVIIVVAARNVFPRPTSSAISMPGVPPGTGCLVNEFRSMEWTPAS